MNKYKKFSKELEALPVKDFVDKVGRLWDQQKAVDSSLEKQPGQSAEDRFLANNPQFTPEEVAELFETPM